MDDKLPDGFVLVPVIPTDAMIEAGWDAGAPDCETGNPDFKAAYAAMLAAAPSVPSAGVEPWQVVLADALGCFWNAALEPTLHANDSTASATVGAIAQGFAAVAQRLQAPVPAPQSGAVERDTVRLDWLIANGRITGTDSGFYRVTLNKDKFATGPYCKTPREAIDAALASQENGSVPRRATCCRVEGDYVLVPRAKLNDWAWSLERNLRRGHKCDVSREAEGVCQSISAMLATPRPNTKDET